MAKSLSLEPKLLRKFLGDFWTFWEKDIFSQRIGYIEENHTNHTRNTVWQPIIKGFIWDFLEDIHEGS